MDNPLLFLFGVIIFAIIIGLATYAIIEASRNKGRRRHDIVGGCDGTRWGCCPDGVTPKYDYRGSNCVSHHRHPSSDDNIGGCAGTRWGCCPDGRTPKSNIWGSNCH